MKIFAFFFTMLLLAHISFSAQAQNVGIGTNTPTEKLTVVQTDAVPAGSFEVNNTANNGAALVVKTNGTANSAKAIYAFRGNSTITPSMSSAITGENNDGTGVAGVSNTSAGVFGGSMMSDGVFGLSINAAGFAGVRGRCDMNGGYGLAGQSLGEATGVYGISTLGNAGKFVISNTANTSNALEGSTSGSGAGVFGSNTNTSAIAAGVVGTNASVSSGTGADNGVSGVLGVITSDNPGGYSSAVRGVNNGTSLYGIGVTGYQAGSGWGVYGECPRGIGVYGLVDHPSAGNIGVRGETRSTNGIGVQATYSGSVVGGTALDINNGAIKVSGTNKAAFRHMAAAANILNNKTTIDNVMTNGDPNAMLFVTHVFGASPSNISSNHPVSVWYDTVASKWVIYYDDSANMPANTVFNVLVIKQ